MTWKLLSKAEQYKEVFASLDHIFALDGKKITYDSISDLIFYPHQGKSFYIKRYYSVGKGIRGFRIYAHAFRLSGKTPYFLSNGAYLLKKLLLMGRRHF